MEFSVLTLFPEMINNTLNHSIIKRAADNKIIKINTVNIRDFADNKHNHIDDYPYGGGAGMLMQAAPVYDAYKSIPEKTRQNARVIYMSPQGRTFNQDIAYELSKEESIIILCGHYEGIDERVLEEIVTDEISIGNYVLTGGELAACVIIDSVSRLITGVLGKNESYETETFSDGLCEYPQYTRPVEFLGKLVPDVLLSGNHILTDKWRREQSVIRTLIKRPDLAKKAVLTQKERLFVKNFISDKMKEIVNKLISEHTISNSDMLYLLENVTPEIQDYMAQKTDFSHTCTISKQNTVFFSNKYRSSCLLDRYDKNNRNIKRFRLTEEEIVRRALNLFKHGEKNIILKCGNDSYFTDEILANIINKIKTCTNLEIIIDFGIKSSDALKLFRNAGADSYIFNIKTSSEQCFKNLYTSDVTFKEYIEFYNIIKKTGFWVYCIFISSLPYQTSKDIVADLKFICCHKPDYSLFKEFTPLEHTEFSDMPSGSHRFAEFLNNIIQFTSNLGKC